MLQKIAANHLSSVSHWPGSVLSTSGGTPKANTCPTCGRPMNNGAPSGGQTTSNPQNPQNPNKPQGYQPPAGFEDWFKGYMEKNYPGNKSTPPQQPPQPTPQNPNVPNNESQSNPYRDILREILRGPHNPYQRSGYPRQRPPYGEPSGGWEDPYPRQRPPYGEPSGGWGYPKRTPRVWDPGFGVEPDQEYYGYRLPNGEINPLRPHADYQPYAGRGLGISRLLDRHSLLQ